MAAEGQAGSIDRDLASIAEARALAPRAKQAWVELAEFSDERIRQDEVLFSHPKPTSMMISPLPIAAT